jgi:hypothetical protein
MLERLGQRGCDKEGREKALQKRGEFAMMRDVIQIQTL